jgi:hypothetical protein
MLLQTGMTRGLGIIICATSDKTDLIEGTATVNARKGIFEIPVGASWIKSQTIIDGTVPYANTNQHSKSLLTAEEQNLASPLFSRQEDPYRGGCKGILAIIDQGFIKAVMSLESSEMDT